VPRVRSRLFRGRCAGVLRAASRSVHASRAPVVRAGWSLVGGTARRPRAPPGVHVRTRQSFEQQAARQGSQAWQDPPGLAGARESVTGMVPVPHLALTAKKLQGPSGGPSRRFFAAVLRFAAPVQWSTKGALRRFRGRFAGFSRAFCLGTAAYTLHFCTRRASMSRAFCGDVAECTAHRGRSTWSVPGPLPLSVVVPGS
jgi:hypothetical protein